MNSYVEPLVVFLAVLILFGMIVPPPPPSSGSL